MKKRNWLIGSVVAGSMLTIGAVGISHACGGMGGPGGHHRGGMMMHMMEKLDLTKQQRQTIRKIRNEQRDQMSAKQDEMFDIRKTLREQATGDNYDAGKVRELANAKAKIMTEMTVKRIETMRRIRKELTPEQVSKLESFKERGFGRGGF